MERQKSDKKRLTIGIFRNFRRQKSENLHIELLNRPKMTCFFQFVAKNPGHLIPAITA